MRTRLKVYSFLFTSFFTHLLHGQTIDTLSFTLSTKGNEKVLLSTFEQDQEGLSLWFAHGAGRNYRFLHYRIGDDWQAKLNKTMSWQYGVASKETPADKRDVINTFVARYGERKWLEQTYFNKKERLKLVTEVNFPSSSCNCVLRSIEEERLVAELPEKADAHFVFGKATPLPLASGITLLEGPYNIKAGRLSLYFQRNVLAYTHDAKISAHEPIVFDYPKDLIFSSALRRENISDTTRNINGGIYIYADPPYVGKKKREPQNTWHFYIFDSLGQKAGMYTMVYPRRSGFAKVLYAHRYKDEVRVLIKNIGDKNPFTLVRLVGSSDSKVSQIMDADLMRTTNSLLMTRFSRIDGHKMLNDGSVLYYGVSSKSVQVDPPKNSPGTVGTGSGIVTKNVFPAFVFAHIDAEGKLLGQFFVGKEPAFREAPGHLVPVGSVGSKFVFVSEQTNFKVEAGSSLEDAKRSAMNNDIIIPLSNQLVPSFGKKMNRLSIPSVIVLDLASKESKSILFKNEKFAFYNLSRASRFVWDDTGKKLYVIGWKTPQLPSSGGPTLTTFRLSF